jgi:hypothetical protein
MFLMAIIFHNTAEKSELQQRITAELREKQARKSKTDGQFETPKYDSEASEYLKNTKQTTSLAWAWALIAAALVGIIIVIVIFIS